MENTRFVHVRNSNDERVATVASALSPHSEDIVILALSRCSKKDQFSKSMGRKVAESRLGYALRHPEVVDNHVHSFDTFGALYALLIDSRPIEVPRDNVKAVIRSLKRGLANYKVDPRAQVSPESVEFAAVETDDVVLQNESRFIFAE